MPILIVAIAIIALTYIWFLDDPKDENMSDRNEDDPLYNSLSDQNNKIKW